MGRVRRLRKWRAAIVFVAGIALAAQALLLTFAASVPAAPAQSAHALHAHDDCPHEDDAPAPADVPAHHRGLCCILGDKLGTALGPVSCPPSPEIRTSFHAIVPAVRAEIAVITRAVSGSLGARAPPPAS